MSTALETPRTNADSTESLVSLPVQAPQSRSTALVSRLVEDFGAQWVDETSLAAWAAQGGDRVVLLAGDAVRFPEGQDVAVVLPELQRSLGSRFQIGVVAQDREDVVARRYGSNRWPTLLFLRDGQYVTTVSGMHDWEVFMDKVSQALVMPVTRAPTIGIPLVAADASAGSACH